MLKPKTGIGVVLTAVLAFGCSDDGGPDYVAPGAVGVVGTSGGAATGGGVVSTGGSAASGVPSGTGGMAAMGLPVATGGTAPAALPVATGGSAASGGDPNAGDAPTMPVAPGNDLQGGAPPMAGTPAVPAEPVEMKPEEMAPVEMKPEEMAPVEMKPEEMAPVEMKPEEMAPVEMGPVKPPAGAKADSGLEGFAAVEKYGLKTTTGGSGGETVKVSSFADLKKHATSREVVVIEVSGTITAPGVHELIKVQSNKTIIGAGGGATLNKITLSVNSWNRPGESCDADDYGSFTPASNVIIRNLNFKGLDKFPDDTKVDPDAIRVECYSHHVWIDHNTFQYGADGATDVKRGADMVTLSYNHYNKTKKTALVGHSDNTGAQDRGFLNVTFHHNHFDNTETRTPRVRWGYVHVYNNYYNTSNHVFRIGPEGKIYAEANYVASKEGKILRSTENDGALTWTKSNVWDKGVFGDIGADKLDANQSVKKPSYKYNAGSAPSKPPAAGVGKL